MRIWKSIEKRPNGIWNSEIRLKEVGVLRRGKLNKLLKLLKEDVRENVL